MLRCKKFLSLLLILTILPTQISNFNVKGLKNSTATKQVSDSRKKPKFPILSLFSAAVVDLATALYVFINHNKSKPNDKDVTNDSDNMPPLNLPVSPTHSYPSTATQTDTPPTSVAIETQTSPSSIPNPLLTPEQSKSFYTNDSDNMPLINLPVSPKHSTDTSVQTSPTSSTISTQVTPINTPTSSDIDTQTSPMGCFSSPSIDIDIKISPLNPRNPDTMQTQPHSNSSNISTSIPITMPSPIYSVPDRPPISEAPTLTPSIESLLPKKPDSTNHVPTSYVEAQLTPLKPLTPTTTTQTHTPPSAPPPLTNQQDQTTTTLSDITMSRSPEYSLSSVPKELTNSNSNTPAESISQIPTSVDLNILTFCDDKLEDLINKHIQNSSKKTGYTIYNIPNKQYANSNFNLHYYILDSNKRQNIRKHAINIALAAANIIIFCVSFNDINKLQNMCSLISYNKDLSINKFIIFLDVDAPNSANMSHYVNAINPNVVGLKKYGVTTLNLYNIIKPIDTQTYNVEELSNEIINMWYTK